MKNLLFLILTSAVFISCEPRSSESQPKVKLGAEVLLDKHIDELKGQRVGLVMNPTSRVDGVQMLDTLLRGGCDCALCCRTWQAGAGD